MSKAVDALAATSFKVEKSESGRKTQRFAKGECPSCQKTIPMEYYCKDCVDTLLQGPLKEFKNQLTTCKGAAIPITGKKRVFRASTSSTAEIREKRKKAAAKRRKTEYEATAKEAKKHFDTWFTEEVTVDKELKNKRIGKEELEQQYVSWHKKKKIAGRLLLSTKAKKPGMHFSTEVLKRINTTLKRKKNNQVTFMDNGASVACFPYISHKKIKHK